MVLLLVLVTLAAWFSGFVLFCGFGIAMIITGKKITKKENSSAVSEIQKPKCSSVFCIIIGAIMIAVSLIILIALLDCIRGMTASKGYDFLDKSLELFLTGIKLILIFLAVCPLAATVLFWVKGIRTAIKLKSIENVDTYNKKLKLSFLFIILGAAGIGVSIILLRMLIKVLSTFVYY